MLPGFCEYKVKKIISSCLLQARERNFFHLIFIETGKHTLAHPCTMVCEREGRTTLPALFSAVINPALRVKLAVKFRAFAFWLLERERGARKTLRASQQRPFFVARSRACFANVFHYCGKAAAAASNMGVGGWTAGEECLETVGAMAELQTEASI